MKKCYYEFQFIWCYVGYEKNIIKNLKLLLNGEEKDIDICLINGQPFVYVAGFGKFVNISYDTPRSLKKKYGYLAYLIEGLKENLSPTLTFGRLLSDSSLITLCQDSE